MNMNDNAENHDADETVVDMPDPSVSGPAAAPAPNEMDLIKDRLLRLQADFDNFRKRAARERAEWQAFANEQLIKEILPVVDHFELGLANAEKNKTPAAVLDGFKLVYEQLIGFLKKQGVSPLSAPPGTPFDPHQHEAISHLPSEEHPADIVIAETRRGYKQGDKMIRPLQVVVSSGPASGESGGN
jgi:molecular chaperone GrpE